MRFDVGALPDAPLEAAAAFHAKVLPLIEQTLAREADSLMIVFGPADYTHQAWRVAAVQALARAHAPRRVNAVASDQAAAIAATDAYLAAAPGVTGQYWPLDGNGAGEVLS